jgi:hypothetical protein
MTFVDLEICEWLVEFILTLAVYKGALIYIYVSGRGVISQFQSRCPVFKCSIICLR